MKKLIFLSAILFTNLIYSQGNVYLIIGSDTAIWEGMSISKYNCYYNYDVIPDNTRNYFEVMQPEYRSKFSDSFGNQLKLTWWLMSGNIFRYSTNLNVPFGNLIVPYEAKKYYGNLFAQFNDELTLHYHTFVWSDYDGDGVYYWNQAKNFNECKSDFYFTLSQMLLEEEIFPVSFRSGWNFMSNEWQAELDKLIPFSMHNEAPAYHNDEQEPLDNLYDWRQATQEFVPYHPSKENYQLAGNGKSWNLHSKYVGNVSQSLMNTIFDKAEKADQVVCLWGHVWDELFPEYVSRIDSLAKISASLHSNVKFRYCSAIEGMQFRMNNNDKTAPVVDVNEIDYGENVKYRISSNEKIFQQQPFAAIKFTNESYELIDFLLVRENEWVSKKYFPKKNIAKFGLAVCDSSGNQTKKIIRYLPDDIYIDNSDSGYIEINGNFTLQSNSSWGLNSRKCILSKNDSAKVQWHFTTKSSGLYNIFIQIPEKISQPGNVQFKVFSGLNSIDTVKFEEPVQSKKWVYISTSFFDSGIDNYIEMAAYSNGQSDFSVTADVVKISPLVLEKSIGLKSDKIDLGQIAIGDTVKSFFSLSNNGKENLTISNILFSDSNLEFEIEFPIVITPFSEIEIPFRWFANHIGQMSDSLLILSDDSYMSEYKISLTAEVTEYFKIVDDSEVEFYHEYGLWATSVAQAYGPTSRYAFLNQNPKAYSVFNSKIKKSGIYDILFIVPETVNAANHALYIVSQGNNFVDSIYVDQNIGSGNWVKLLSAEFSSALPVQIKISDDGNSASGAVLRADAVKLQLISPTSQNDILMSKPTSFNLYQNYPNPFNPTTTIKYSLPEQQFVSLKVYDILGSEVATLVNEQKPVGNYEVNFDATKLSSGVYFFQIRADNFWETKKMLLMK